MKVQPTISVALCTYNGEKFLVEQLESILNQTLPVDEIVVCDDGSVDNTMNILNDYKLKNPQLFSIYQNEKNLGYVKNFEKALSLCTQEIVFLCDQDDVWFPQKTQNIISVFSQNPDIDFVVHNLNFLKDNTQISKPTFWEYKNFNYNSQNNKEILKNLVFTKNFFPGMSMAFRREALKNTLPLKQIHPKIIHDYELSLQFFNQNTAYVYNQVLAAYRIHSDQNMGNKIDVNRTQSAQKIRLKHIKNLDKRTFLINEIIEKLKLSPTLKNDFVVYKSEIVNKFVSQKFFLIRPFWQLAMKKYQNT